MKKLLKISTAALVMSTAFFVSGASARDQLSIVGSSTVYPFASAVAEKFGQSTDFKTPVIESTGSGGGLKMFCKGIGTNTADITNASRAIKSKEKAQCAEAGITPIEYLIGYDGITISNSKQSAQASFTKEDIFKAVSHFVWLNDEWVLNPYKKWRDIRPELPNKKIDIMIPPTTSGTRDAFVELIMHKVCKKKYGMDKKTYKAQCTGVRTDGTYVVQMGENDNLLIEKLLKDENRFAVFGFSFLDQNRDRVQGAIIDGVEPDFDTIADGSYGVSRPLYFYVKKQHIGVVPGIEEYVDMFMSPKMIGEDGVLTEMGLIAVQ